MKNRLTKFATVILLVFSVIFGGLAASSFLSSPAQAIRAPILPEVDEENPSEDSETSDEEAPSEEDGSEETEGSEDGSEDSEDGEAGDDAEAGEADEETSVNVCKEEAGSLYWVICPTTQVISGAVDKLYGAIEDMLVVKPLTTDDTSPIYIVWKYMRSITNIAFVILLLIVILSQVTGFGINNYGVKRVLPRLIIAVILVNLSFLICSLAVDVSNVVGYSLRGFFLDIQEKMLAASGEFAATADISIATIVGTLLGGASIAGIAIGVAGGMGQLFWALAIVLIGALGAVIAGLITIAGRQALVALLVMVAPLAMVAYLLPNTERWFNQWKNLLLRMLIFYPMFSFLFGASQLVGWALIAAASNGFGVVLGLAVQIFPLFFSWSLMKMSGTILESVHSGLRRAMTPLQRNAAGWAMEHREDARQSYYAHSAMSGSRLREYLDKRRDLRMLNTHNNLETRRNRSMQWVYTRASSISGRNDQGNMTWDGEENRYTRSAKTASYYTTAAETAQAAYQNTLSAYGRHFDNRAAQRLSDLHGEAFADSMAQRFLATNEAQSDQEWLLNRYLTAATNMNTDRYEYNRFIKDAAGGLGHNGESSIMGQVIYNSSVIENRRRGEARIIATKFGVSKTQMRGMTFDKAFINDNGYETDENGVVIEDDQYNLLEKYKDRHKPWQYYIAVNKKTDREITREEYDALPEVSRKNNLGEIEVEGKDLYRKVRYFDILNDDGKPVQRVFEDDAGYMKELLRDDIAIGDPINIRYLTEIGVAHAPGEKTGQLRRYHSTISAAMLETKYKEHSAEVTPMITAQTNAGYVTTKGQYNIGNLQSLAVASKPGSFFQNDAFAIENWGNIFACVGKEDDGSIGSFSYYFPDAAIEYYRNVNGKALGGLRAIYNDDAEQIGWQELSPDESPTLEEKKNLLKHKIIPKAAAKVAGMLGNNIPQAARDGQKPDTIKALDKLTDQLIKINYDNFGLDEAGNVVENPLAFNQRLNPSVDILAAPDSNIFKQKIEDAKKILQAALGQEPSAEADDYDGDDGGNSGGGGNNGPSGSARHSNSNSQNSGGGNSGGNNPVYEHNPYARQSIHQAMKKLQRDREAQAQYDHRNSYETIRNTIDDYFAVVTDYESLGQQLIDYFGETERLQNLQGECADLVDYHRYKGDAESTDDIIEQTANLHDKIQESIDNLHAAILDLLDTISFD